ncbi:MAG: tetratricopeptide repeat protein [Pseudomonadales bacterium]
MMHVRITAGLAALTAIIFGSLIHHDFINYDTLDYIHLNEHVSSGLSLTNIQWALTSFHVSNWHPLTWISHMLDVSLFGLNPAGHLGVNLFLHTVNVVLLFQILRLMTGELWAAAFIAALFAIHPAHVESVAWVAERKDVLSTSFLLLTLFAWRHYTQVPTLARYTLVVVLLALGLMAKPMLVTLPFVLLLFDYWPLGRMTGFDRFRVLVYEKLPLLALSLISAIITFRAQQTGGAMDGGAALDLAERLGNAVVAYGHYLKTALIPANLALLYPHPGRWAQPLIWTNLALLTAISAAAVVWIRRFPWFFVGWAFFLGTLVPVIGIVQVGAQAYADRYTYVPYIGLFVALTFAIREIWIHFTPRATLLRYAAVCLIAVYSIATVQYLGHWQNSITIWTHTLMATDRNYPIVMGLEDGSPERSGQARGLFRAWYMLGRALADSGYHDQALIHFNEALSLDPDAPNAHYFKGFSLLAMDRPREAMMAFDKVMELDPDNRVATRQIKIIRRELFDQGNSDQTANTNM